MIIAGINKACDAVPQQLGRRECCGYPHVVAIERRFVGIHALEQKRLVVRLVGEPARQLEGRMQMAIDEAGGRHGIAAVDAVPGRAARRDIGRFADRDDLAPIDCDRGVANDAAPGVHGDQPGDVGNDEVDELHGLFLFVTPRRAGKIALGACCVARDLGHAVERRGWTARALRSHDRASKGEASVQAQCPLYFSPTYVSSSAIFSSISTFSSVESSHSIERWPMPLGMNSMSPGCMILTPISVSHFSAPLTQKMISWASILRCQKPMSCLRRLDTSTF